jgi:hypothetical protein
VIPAFHILFLIFAAKCLKSSSNKFLKFDCRMGIKAGVEWLVDAMERSKRTQMLRARAGVTGPASA